MRWPFALRSTVDLVKTCGLAAAEIGEKAALDLKAVRGALGECQEKLRKAQADVDLWHAAAQREQEEVERQKKKVAEVDKLAESMIGTEPLKVWVQDGPDGQDTVVLRFVVDRKRLTRKPAQVMDSYARRMAAEARRAFECLLEKARTAAADAATRSEWKA